jgi:hypothetical protein
VKASNYVLALLWERRDECLGAVFLLVVVHNEIVTEYFHTVGVLREVKRVRPDFSVISGWGT